ncbi:MAG: hypothetical protein KJ824_02150 [Alphaproteobacteria bacterium]|nr:hypothetical protein [Alphaproteobacteria bacterium]
MQRIALPWLLPLGCMVIVAVVAESFQGTHAYWVTILAVVMLGLPAMLGMMYAMITYLLAGFRADRQKRRASSSDTPPS